MRRSVQPPTPPRYQPPVNPVQPALTPDRELQPPPVQPALPPRYEAPAPPQTTPRTEAVKPPDVIITPPPVYEPPPRYEPPEQTAPPSPRYEPPAQPVQQPAAPPPRYEAPAPPPTAHNAPLSLNDIQDGMEITADELDMFFRTEKTGINSKLTGKLLVIRGFVEKVFVREHLDIRYIVLTGSQKKMVWSIRCTFSKEEAIRVTRLKEGQEIMVRAKYDGYGKNIIFKDCSLL
jgi:hypothetical protein